MKPRKKRKRRGSKPQTPAAVPGMPRVSSLLSQLTDPVAYTERLLDIELLPTQREIINQVLAHGEPGNGDATIVNHAREVASHYTGTFSPEQLANVLGIPTRVLGIDPADDGEHTNVMEVDHYPDSSVVVRSMARLNHEEWAFRINQARDKVAPLAADFMRRAVDRMTANELREREMHLNGQFMNGRPPDTYMEPPKEDEPPITAASPSDASAALGSLNYTIQQLRAAGVGVTFESDNPWSPPHVRWHYPSTVGADEWQYINPSLSRYEAVRLVYTASPYPRRPPRPVAYERHPDYESYELHPAQVGHMTNRNPCGEIPQGETTAQRR